jgi:hypothetical protein
MFGLRHVCRCGGKAGVEGGKKVRGAEGQRGRGAGARFYNAQAAA